MLQLFKGIFQAFKLLQTLAYMAEVPSQKGIHLTAIRVRLVGQAYELPDFVLCHIQVTATFDEQQAIKVALPVLTIATGQAVGCRHQPDFFVVANGFYRNACGFRDFADFHGCSPAVCPPRPLGVTDRLQWFQILPVGQKFRPWFIATIRLFQSIVNAVVNEKQVASRPARHIHVGTMQRVALEDDQ